MTAATDLPGVLHPALRFLWVSRMLTGSLVTIVEDRGFAVIRPEGACLSKDVFLHQRDLPEVKLTSALLGRRVQFELGERDGRELASSARLVD